MVIVGLGLGVGTAVAVSVGVVVGVAVGIGVRVEVEVEVPVGVEVEVEVVVAVGVKVAVAGGVAVAVGADAVSVLAAASASATLVAMASGVGVAGPPQAAIKCATDSTTRNRVIFRQSPRLDLHQRADDVFHDTAPHMVRLQTPYRLQTSAIVLMTCSLYPFQSSCCSASVTASQRVQRI